MAIFWYKCCSSQGQRWLLLSLPFSVPLLHRHVSAQLPEGQLFWCPLLLIIKTLFHKREDKSPDQLLPLSCSCYVLLPEEHHRGSLFRILPSCVCVYFSSKYYSFEQAVFLMTFTAWAGSPTELYQTNVYVRFTYRIPRSKREIQKQHGERMLRVVFSWDPGRMHLYSSLSGQFNSNVLKSLPCARAQKAVILCNKQKAK